MKFRDDLTHQLQFLFLSPRVNFLCVFLDRIASLPSLPQTALLCNAFPSILFHEETMESFKKTRHLGDKILLPSDKPKLDQALGRVGIARRERGVLVSSGVAKTLGENARTGRDRTCLRATAPGSGKQLEPH